MITIMTKHDDNSTLNFLATECEYEVTISEETSELGGISVLCEGKDAGQKAMDVIDENRLLADEDESFPTILGTIYNIVEKTPKIGL